MWMRFAILTHLNKTYEEKGEKKKKQNSKILAHAIYYVYEYEYV